MDENNYFSFKPEINKQSYDLTERNQINNMSVEQRLLVKGRIKNDKIKRLQKVALQEELNKCTFEPVLKTRSNS